MDLRRRAQDLLARREYGRAELAARLRRDARRARARDVAANPDVEADANADADGVRDEAADVGPVLDQLVAEGSLSDERFVSSFVDARIRRGKGPLLIRAELERRGVAEAEIERFITFPDAFWIDHARAVRAKRFGVALPETPTDRARQSRFLASRGFAGEAIRFATRS